MTIRRACPKCGRVVNIGRRYCPAHKPPVVYQLAEYRINRAHVLATEHTCWICGEPARESDPLTADHIVPVSAGGNSTRANLRAAHRSCNSRRGANHAGA